MLAGPRYVRTAFVPIFFSNYKITKNIVRSHMLSRYVSNFFLTFLNSNEPTWTSKKVNVWLLVFIHVSVIRPARLTLL